MKILYVDIDTLRPDHLGCYGYGRSTSPNIDAVAADGVRFEDYYCSDAPCLPSRAALMTGRFGIHTGCVGHGGINAEICREGPERGMADFNGRYNLPAVLRRAGDVSGHRAPKLWTSASICPSREARDPMGVPSP